MIRVLVVDDSAFMRNMITEFLTSNQQIAVAGTARNGEEALQKIEELRPDVVTLDIEMPVMDGKETLKNIMAKRSLPVIMVSSLTQRGADITIECLEIGAVDFVGKPSGSISFDLYKVREELIEKVLAAGRAKVNPASARLPKQAPLQTSAAKSGGRFIPSGASKQLVCIGTSTGGPKALQRVLPKLPRTLKAPVFVVQHMPAGFTASLANRLNHLSEVTVKEAEHGERAKAGWVYIAPGGKNMTVHLANGELVISLDDRDTGSRHKPSVDYLFNSLATLTGFEKIAVIMTGMGSDGTEGVKNLLRHSRGPVIAESEESCVVFGMPKAVINNGLADDVKHVDEIAAAIMTYTK
ncbi:protein-glutamate methylesterase/protein-glutamine glutaminase [Bacillus glycinifermentans]|uniref:Protein-glutamate methylesterase/protein-glutamine glutaminase n=1 Tax=Bacillus glycinifermentans TaxID=1664069 RepID=A0A0T6BQD3_9BACI|nr:chemotaxis response regulator protein-glutamate methylesterase [Bacillus glycinifermentans]ATH91438.1 chemotaxis response regulator protein-glutamate methylesterase [Bacillus glycinifermentans]KRT93864.1 two-component system response regulator protein-glutamate methylesterase [Bacillus glycinifermentans]MEC0485244.1 chemotaxis response regulator protein-glutamate methylesterase [Bacillus glycinifermentans]MEC0495570.1 chemotaxis response regulator protein-glutamate methylesterase [Bacillus g